MPGARWRAGGAANRLRRSTPLPSPYGDCGLARFHATTGSGGDGGGFARDLGNNLVRRRPFAARFSGRRSTGATKAAQLRDLGPIAWVARRAAQRSKGERTATGICAPGTSTLSRGRVHRRSSIAWGATPVSGASTWPPSTSPSSRWRSRALPRISPSTSGTASHAGATVTTSTPRWIGSSDDDRANPARWRPRAQTIRPARPHRLRRASPRGWHGGCFLPRS